MQPVELSLTWILRSVIPHYGKYLSSYGQYRWSRGSYKAYGSQKDLVFVLKRKGTQWTLQGICDELARYGPPNHGFHYVDSGEALPVSRAYFFARHSILGWCLRTYPFLWGRRILIFYTHEKGREHQRKEFIHAVNRCEGAKVVCMNSMASCEFIREGMKPEKVTWVQAGADPDFFQPHERRNGAVGLSTAYYHRKNPDLILEIIRSLPHRRFILVGPPSSDPSFSNRNWDRYERFGELRSLGNLTYVEAPYTDYPKYYSQMDVFLSTSKLEGGPLSLLEAMMCNIVPVASKVGFAPDIIVHGRNGYLFDIGSPARLVCENIERAFSNRENIRATVEHLTWGRFAMECQRLLGESDKPLKPRELAVKNMVKSEFDTFRCQA